MNVASPCVKICQLDEAGCCAACRRTLAEIAGWSGLSEPEKNRVLAALPERRAKRASIEIKGTGE